MAVFHGIRDIDLPVRDIDRSLRLYRDVLGFPLVSVAGGVATLDAASVQLRLFQTRSPEHRAAIRVQSPEVDEALAALIAAGAVSLYAAMRTPEQELMGAVRDADGHTIYVFRPLTEDEYDFVPELPKELSWDDEAEQLMHALLKKVPALFRALARHRVTKEAESLAARTRRVTREEVIRGFILASPRVTRGRNKKPMIELGIDVDRYRADWEAD